MDSSAKKKLLIVEDETFLLDVLKEHLSKEGFHVVTARDGEEGLGAALTEKPDLILLDIIMPRMDGMTMLRKLREDAWGKTVPIIFLTNLDATEKIAEGLQSGVFEYLVKSDWKIEDVVRKVNARLGRKT